MLGQTSREGLSLQEIRMLRGKLHTLRPLVVLDNKGIKRTTDSGMGSWLFHKIDQELESSELVKIRTNIADKHELSSLAKELCTTLKATLVQTVGYIIAIYRKNLDLENSEQEVDTQQKEESWA